MAEKNTESTAVNELIELVATQKPLPPDPSEDLMFSERPAPRRATKQMSPPRMTSTVPPIRGAGEVAPLPPPTRVPTGTQQGIKTIKMPPPPNVRVSTAPPSRSVTIPPVAQPPIAQPPITQAPMTLDFEDENDVTNPEHDAMARVTKPTLPPPLPTVRGVGAGTGSRPSLPRPSLPRPSLPTQSFDYPVVKHPAQELPVVAPPIAAPLVLENELVTSAAVTNPSMPALQLGPDSTHHVPKAGDWKAIVSKLIAPMIVLVIIGIFVGGYFAFDGEGGKKREPKPEAPKVTMPVTQGAATGDVAKTETPANAVEAKAGEMNAGEAKADEMKAGEMNADQAKADEVNAGEMKAGEMKADPAANTATANTAVANTANTATANTAAANTANTATANTATANTATANTAAANTAAANTADANTPAVKPVLVDIRVDSNPSGATVNLIDRGKSMYLGTTPLSAAVDATRKYELVFSYENRGTVVEALDPSKQKRVTVKLSRAKADEPKREHRHRSSKSEEAPKTEAPKTEAPKTEAPKTEPAKAEPAAKANVGGEGTLMISSKPPCEIVIDGKPTGLTTPQRSIPLSAGAHKITLVNSAEGIKKTMSVQITADKPTKVIQDFMK